MASLILKLCGTLTKCLQALNVFNSMPSKNKVFSFLRGFGVTLMKAVRPEYW